MRKLRRSRTVGKDLHNSMLVCPQIASSTISAFESLESFMLAMSVNAYPERGSDCHVFLF